MLIFMIKESGSTGDEAAAMIVAEHREDFKYLRQKAEMSTQTDRKAEADISTQTGEEGDDNTTTNIAGPVEEVVAATEEDRLNESVVIAEEAVEEMTDQEPGENQTAGIIIEEVVMENIIYENLVFRAERVEVTDNFEITHIEKYNPEEERVQETEPEVAAEPESIKEGEIAVEETHFEETVTLEIASLPKVVADCVEVVFAAVSESTDFAVVNTSEPSVDEVITEGNSEGARDIPADAVLIETTEPKTNAATPETQKANGVASLHEEPVTTMTEITSEVVCEEPDPPSAHKDMPEREHCVPLVPIIIIMKEYSYEGVTTDEAVAVEYVSGMSEEAIIVEAPSNELITTEELPQDALNAPADEVKPEFIPKVITPYEKTDVCEGMTADEEPEKVVEAEPRPVIVKEDAEMIPEAAIDALSQYLELPEAPQQPAVHSGSLFEEEVIAATTFVPLSGERQAEVSIPGEPIESAAKEMNEEAVISEEPTEENPSPCEEDATTEVLVNILESVVEVISERLVVTENIIEALADEDATGESERCAALQEEPVVENVARSVVAVEEPTDSSHVISEEPLEESMSPLVPQVQVVILKTIEDEVTAELVNESNHYCDVLAAIDENSGDSQIATSNEAAAECFEAVLETIVEEFITEDAITPQEPVVENEITLEEAVIAARPFAPLSGEREANVTIPEESRETTAEVMKEEATKPESVGVDTTVQASSNEEEITQIASSTETVEEKTEGSEYVLAQAETPQQTPVILEAPVEENPSPCGEDVTTERMENILESVGEVNSEKLVVTENKVENPSDVPLMDATGESKSCFHVQGEFVEEKVTPAVVVLKEPTDSSPVIYGEPILENVSLLEHQALVAIQTNGGKVCGSDSCGDILAVAYENTEDSHIDTSDEAVAECVEAVLETIVEEIIAEGAIPSQEHALENAIRLQVEVFAATPFVPLSGEQEPNLTIPEEPSETDAEKMDDEAIKALSNETTTEPESVEEDTTDQESSTEAGVFRDVRSDEPVEEKTEVSEDGLTQAETPKQIPTISEEPVYDSPSPWKEGATTEVNKNILESVVEVISEDIVEEPADVPQAVTIRESEPCVSFQEIVEENVNPSVVAVEEQTASIHVISEESVEESVSLLPRPPLVVIIETTDIKQTEEEIQESFHFHDNLAAVYKNSIDSQNATSDASVAECFEAVLETIIEEVITEDVAAQFVISDEVGPKMFTEGDTEQKVDSISGVNSGVSTRSAEMTDDTPITSSDMETLLARLQSACTSIVEESTYRLDSLNMSFLGCSITVTIKVAPKEERH